MTQITREQLHAFLDDALNEVETARIELAIRDSETLRKELRLAMQERDRGEHSLGAIWRRERLTCASREQLGSYLLGVLDEAESDYLTFHLETIGCPFCLANFSDLKALQEEPVLSDTRARERRHRIFHSSAGFLQTKGE